MKKKILAFLLTGAMFLGAVPAQVYASAPQESVGIENTEDDQEDFNDQTEDIEEEKTDEEAEQTEETTELEQEQTGTTDEALADKEEGQTSQDETECKDSEQIELPNIEQDAKGRESISSTDQEIEAAKQSAEEQAAPVADKEESLNWTPPTGTSTPFRDNHDRQDSCPFHRLTRLSLHQQHRSLLCRRNFRYIHRQSGRTEEFPIHS